MMKSNRGSAGVIALIIIGIIGFLAVSVVALVINAANTANRMEQNIVSSDESRQNVLSNYTTKVMEAAQIPAMQRDDVKEVITAALSARYGDDGSGAAFQWIQEQNPQIDSTVYTKLQTIIASGRDEFRFSQDQLIDKVRVYRTAQGYVFTGFMMRLAGYPKIDLADYKPIVELGVQQKFEAGTDSALKLR